MELYTASRLNRLAMTAEAKTFKAGRPNIGPRLMLGFAVIIFSMLAADAVVLWQFHLVRAQAERLNGIDQKLVAVLRLHTSLTTFHDRLEDLADSQDIRGLVTEGESLRAAVLEDSRRAVSAFALSPFDFEQDPTIQPILYAVQSALPAQLDAITTLAASGDWRAVHQRLANQVKPLESLTSDLVEKVGHTASEQRAQTVRNLRAVERLIVVVVPLTVLITLLIAGSFALAVTRSITQPLARLVEGSKALARGDFQHTVPVTGTDELAELGRVFNDTARRLQDLYATLQQSEDRLRLVIDTIPAHVWSTRPDGSVDFINRRWLETSGVDVEDTRAWDLGSTVHPDDLARYVNEWRAALATGQPMESEVRLRQADRKYRWWLTRNVPLRNDVGNIIKWYGTAIDIEDRKRAEQERERLRQLEADLAHVNRVSMLGELGASLSHELKQPIAAAITNADTCLRWLKRDQPDVEEASEAVTRIVEAGNRAAEIINRLRSFYTKSAPVERELVDVNELIPEMLVLLRSEANRHSLPMRTDLAADLPRVTADRVQLQQVFLNLMLNGIEAMKDSGGVLTIVSQLDNDDQLLISISDTGVGLPAEKADQIFNAFFTTKPQGSGMGLAISRSIVESHGGRLWASANSGRGATFHLTLPTAAEVAKECATGI
jgi:PAS domain S-box-containing protein